MGLCSKLDGDDNTSCRKPQNLCVADPNFRFNLNEPNSEVTTTFEVTLYAKALTCHLELRRD